MHIDLLIVLFGLGVGVLVGTTGIGGGSVMTPLLILVFGIQPVTAVGSDLAYAAATKTLGGWRHVRNRTVDFALAGWLAVGSVPGAVGGVFALQALNRHYGKSFQDLLLGGVAIILILTAAAILVRAAGAGTAGGEHTAVMSRGRKALAVAIGVLVGFVLGVTSAGSGALIAVALLLLFRLSPRRVVGTDLFHSGIVLWVASALQVVEGNVDFGLVGTILIGSLPGVWIGSRLAVRLPENGLQPVLGVLLFAAGLSLLSKAGVGIPPAAYLGVVLALAAAVALIHRRRSRRSREARARRVPDWPDRQRVDVAG